MKLQELSLYLSFVKVITTFTFRFAVQKVRSVIHKHTYRASPNPRNVVVIGGSYAGSYLVQRLTNTLPSGYRVVLLEKQSHFNHAFAFPRNSVFPGRESKAFIPYDNIADGAPEGIFQRVCDEALEVTDTDIEMASGNRLRYDYLVIATGAAQPPPARLNSRDREGCITELQGFQQRISKAERIAVVGGGAVGVELITEIREKYPDKQLTLIHSRDQLLPRFGAKLHELVLSTLRAKNIEVLLKERPVLPAQSGQAVKETQISLSNGEKRIWDLIIPCTGLRPRSDLLATYSLKSIASTGEILVKPTLQVDYLPSSKGNIFAIGDVARSGGAKQGRAALMQSEVVTSNIVSLIKNKKRMEEYKPIYFEGALNLTLGKDLILMYIKRGDFEWVKEMKGHGDEDVGAGKQWKMLHAKETA
ncbi:hypothetical protein CDV36_004036 [Fusarium kuroshium]|uniref:FAD/NAD(P)-binding domain-containing protein n=1 Tax=Fusarium kuroshium TaxID=2010991 RepID=A0A3M2SFD5_9HYPO|nr:hypothetical protein CDV36_004036 [Fusarium kuroshium]